MMMTMMMEDTYVKNSDVTKFYVAKGAHHRRERGIELTEMALVLPILLLLVAATVEFGMFFKAYATLSKATCASARYISSTRFDQTEKEKAKRIAVCGDPISCVSKTPVLAGLTMDNIEIISAGGVNFPDTVTVRVTGYNYQPIFNLGGLLGGNGWLETYIRPSTTMRYMLSN